MVLSKPTFSTGHPAALLWSVFCPELPFALSNSSIVDHSYVLCTVWTDCWSFLSLWHLCPAPASSLYKTSLHTVMISNFLYPKHHLTCLTTHASMYWSCLKLPIPSQLPVLNLITFVWALIHSTAGLPLKKLTRPSLQYCECLSCHFIYLFIWIFNHEFCHLCCALL